MTSSPGAGRPRPLARPRLARALPFLAPLLASAVLGACTADAPGTPTATTQTSGAASPAPSAGAGVSVSGAPDDLVAVVEVLYAGGEVPASATAAAAVASRRPAGVDVTAEASLGEWGGVPVAVVTAGPDVTLLTGPDWRVVGGWWPSLGVDEPSLGEPGPRWVLAIGSDARSGQDPTRTRADTLQVVGIDGEGGGGVMGLARDLWVPVSTGGRAKINSAMVAGGPEAQVETVRDVTGLALEGYVLIDFDGFEAVVDEQGGLPVVIPETVTAANGRIVLRRGPQVLSGREALAYARERKSLPDGDFGRSRHQGELILAAAVKARLAGVGAVPGAMTSLDDHAWTDLGAEEALTFAAALYRLEPAKVGRGVAAGATGWAGSQSIVVLGDQAKGLFADFADGNL